MTAATHDFRREILDVRGHRPWPMPALPWVLTQTWHDLLFAHWPASAATLRPLVPRELDLDLFDGRAWIGVVPFEMTNVAPRGVPALPWLSAFPEINVRTYVTVRGTPGVYFFSLDAANLAAVWAARAWFRLPYYHAAIAIDRTPDAAVRYRSRRHAGAARFEAEYRPAGGTFEAVAGSREHFLTERYCLYTVVHGRVFRTDVHHPPWSLQPAAAEITANTMTSAARLPLDGDPPLLHYSRRQDVVAWRPVRV